MDERELIEMAGEMADEVDRRIRKGEIDYAWMEEFFLSKLKEINDGTWKK